MNTVIFRTMAPILAFIMTAFSLILLLRGHAAPGGGFVGGLVAAAAIAIYAMAVGVETARQRLRVDPMIICGAGVLLAIASGLVSLHSSRRRSSPASGFPPISSARPACSTSASTSPSRVLCLRSSLGLEDSGEGALMEAGLTLLVGLFIAGGIYLLLSRALIRIVLGWSCSATA